MTNTNGLTLEDFKQLDELKIKSNTQQLILIAQDWMKTYTDRIGITKFKCPSCNSNCENAIMSEEGVNYPIHKCTKCGWWA